ncbi:sigma-70 family RNA polymerase sigma factor [Planosporangium thailandense]|uniref:Sigma-70 family RNA polymerase sigma factor n=1 Tax=Planosporangium thailandense TaxID=765197 RepID=A0ABX0XXM4_9ACTN|nr:sigma-70 family RNA polymerase sigma factor [Planosporangium thailandense]NJC70776.1 sigma-70 family RNA polymerase sigma factor [Planosporangium thailandense]
MKAALDELARPTAPETPPPPAAPLPAVAPIPSQRTAPPPVPVDGSKASGEALVRTLYEEHGRSLLAYATRLTGDRASAEDVMQETLLRAWKHSATIVNQKGSVRGWLLTVARNIVTDRARARAARPTEVAESPTTGPVAGDHADAIVDSMVVLDALQQLSADHRQVLVELYYRGRSVSEAAQVLGVPPGTVKSRTYYALRAMRSVLDAAGGEVEDR